MKSKIDYILLILNCYKYSDKRLKQKNDWINYLPKHIKYYHIIGDKAKCCNKDYLIDDNENIIYVNTDDDYNHLPEKIITAFQCIYENYIFKYIFKTDDDQKLINSSFFINFTNKLNKELKLFNSYSYNFMNTNNYIMYHYGGNKIKCNKHICNYYNKHPELNKDIILKETDYCNGRFYFLSKVAVNYLIKNKDSIKKDIIEDHSIGYHLHRDLKKNIFNFNTNKIFVDY